MKVKLKLNTAYGNLTPNEITLSDNEELEISVLGSLQGQGVLSINALSFVENDGKFTIPKEDLQETNSIYLEDIKDGQTVKKWRVNALIVRNNGCDDYQTELLFYKEKVKTLEVEIIRLQEFQSNATNDILNLTKALNMLNEEFKSVKEEMSL